MDNALFHIIVVYIIFIYRIYVASATAWFCLVG